MDAEEDIDAESLQAQIDMSMSFAHDLVTSWIKPTHIAQLRSGGSDATQIMEESRRPPRLGVGASIPTAPLPAQEASKLKRRLWKNGTKNECATDSKPQDHSKSDDEEHKGRPAKRKMSSDPFGQESKKKKRKAESISSLYPSTDNVFKHPASPPKNPAFGGLAKQNLSSGKEKQWIAQADQQSHATEEQRSTTPIVSSPPVRLPVQTTFSPSLMVSTIHSHLEPPRETSAPVPGSPECSRGHTNFMSISDKAKPHGTPLLNLDGPPGFVNKPGNTIASNDLRRKRKRRKKKNRTTTGTGYK